MSLLLSAVVEAAQSGAAPTPGYRPFLTPLPGAWHIWYLLIVPLCLAVSIVYKSIKCERITDVPKQAALICFWILFFMSVGAALLVAIVKVHTAIVS